MTLSFINPGILDDLSFHPCVRYNRWEQNRIVSFVPPDGQFNLMNYRVKGQLQLPLYVKPQINLANGGKVNIMVGPKNNQGKVIEEVVITIPFPKSVTTANLTANFGYINYDDIAKIAKWFVGRLPVNKTPMLEGTVQFPPITNSITSSGSGNASIDNSNPILSVEFKINMLSASGLRVDTLSLHNERYKPFKGVRSVTKGGKFYVRS